MQQLIQFQYVCIAWKVAWMQDQPRLSLDWVVDKTCCR